MFVHTAFEKRKDEVGRICSKTMDFDVILLHQTSLVQTRFIRSEFTIFCYNTNLMWKKITKREITWTRKVETFFL